MTVLIDTNIILDYTLRRHPWFNHAKLILQMCASGRINGFVALHSVSNIWYIMRRIPAGKRRRLLCDILDIIQVCGVSHQAVVEAVENTGFKDFEDCLQDQCASELEADYVITRNIEDFVRAKTTAITAEDFCRLMNHI